MLGLLHRRISGRCMLSHFRLVAACRRNRLLPDRRSRFAHRTTYLRLALWRVARSRRRRRIFFRCRSRLQGVPRLLVLWNRFRPGFPLRFGFCFRQLVDSPFCHMLGLPHGMVGGVCDLAALVAIFRLTVLRCLAPRRNAARGADLRVSTALAFSDDFSFTSRITTPAPPVQTSLSS